MPQPAADNDQPPIPARSVSPPPSDWQAAEPVPPEPMTLDWELPVLGESEHLSDVSGLWSTPPSVQRPYQPPAQEPAPSWGQTPPNPQYLPPAPPFPMAYPPQYPMAYPPQYLPQYPWAYFQQAYLPQAYLPQAYLPQAYPFQGYPPQQDYRPIPNQPPWLTAQPTAQAHDPLAGLPGGQYVAPGPQLAPTPYTSTPPQTPVQSFQSVPGSRTGTGDVAGDQADMVRREQSDDDGVQPEGRSSSIQTAGLTIGFALAVIVLVLVFIQLMTSLLR
jgi:hypothetical protein